MTIPTLMNCQHSGSGWCLECVRNLHAENERLRTAGLRIEKLFLDHGDPFSGDDWQAMQEIRFALEIIAKVTN